jgi:hypothetical protein
MYSSNRGDTVLDCFGGGLTTGRTALRWGRNFIGFELNKNAYDAFVPTLDAVEELPDPVPISPDAVELAKREKMRQGWRKDRAKKKSLNNILFEEVHPSHGESEDEVEFDQNKLDQLEETK